MKENSKFESFPVPAEIERPSTDKKEEIEGGGETYKEVERKVVLHGLSRNGVLEEKGGMFVVDSEKIKDGTEFSDILKRSTSSFQGKKINLNREAVLNNISSLRGVEKKRYEQGKDDVVPIPLVNLPQNRQDALRGVFPGGVLEMEEIDKKIGWNKQINLPDGSTFSVGELFLSRKLNELESKRENGILKIRDPRSGEFEDFDPHRFLDIVKRRLVFNQGEERIFFERNPGGFVKKVCPQLWDQGVFKESDFSSEKMSVYNLKQIGVVSKNGDGEMVMDKEKLRTFLEQCRDGDRFGDKVDNLSPNRARVTSAGLVDALIHNKFATKDLDGEVRPGLALPESKDAALKGDFNNQGLFLLEDLREYIPWDKKITLKDGSTFNYAELYVAHMLKELQVRRGEHGLEIFDPREGQEKFKRFSPRLFVDITGKDPSMTDKEKTASSQKGPGLKKEGNIKFGDNPILFTERHMPSLLQSGVLRREDFKVSNRGQTSEVFRVHDQRFGKKNPYVYFSSGEGGARYYLGKSKIVGTTIPVTPDIVARELDENLIAIINTSYGREKILRYFPVFSPEELDKKHEGIIKRRGKENPSLTWLGQNTYANGEEMETRLREYKVTDFLPIKPGEETEAYAERVARLSDTKFVMDSFSTLFRQAGVGTHKLPWKEQLVLAEIVMDKAKESKLLPFVKKYKIAGLRTFLSLEYGRELGDDIVALGEKLPKEEVQAIFDKYSEIIDYANRIQEVVRGWKKIESVDETKLQDRLMRKARGVLVDFVKAVNVAGKTKETFSEGEVMERLSLIQGELLLINELVKQKVVKIEALDNVAYESKDGKGLTNQERDEMLAVYRQNHNVKYRGEHLEYLMKDFESRITGANVINKSTFHVLKLDEKVAAFVSTEELPDGTLYIDDLETNPSLLGSSVGFDLFQKVTEMYPERTLSGHVWAGEENKALVRKYRQAGWIIDMDHPEKLGESEELYFKATRPPKIVPVQEKSPLEIQEAA